MLNKKPTYRVAVVGATGAVGQEMIEVLEERKFPVETLLPLASSRSAGGIVSFQGKDLVIRELTKDSFNGIDIALFSAGADVSREYAPIAAKAGAVVIDNSSAWRMDKDVPLVVPEVNLGDLAQHQGIIANPNCSTIHLVLALKPIQDTFGIEQGIVTTLQAASGAGYPGVPSLDLIDNVIPYISGEEEKIESESRKILGRWADGRFEDAPLTLSAHCNRVPVRDGHMETVSLKLAQPAPPEEIARVLAEFRARPQ
ncbi:MAG: aspartate-semialdehyde dehydrogenase, partial [Nitrospiraceae bacterium]